jgi:hypothetical protein
VGIERDLVAEREQERAVAGRPDGHWVNVFRVASSRCLQA